jgi:hypothetical protein
MPRDVDEPLRHRAARRRSIAAATARARSEHDHKQRAAHHPTVFGFARLHVKAVNKCEAAPSPLQDRTVRTSLRTRRSHPRPAATRSQASFMRGAHRSVARTRHRGTATRMQPRRSCSSTCSCSQTGRSTRAGRSRASSRQGRARGTWRADIAPMTFQPSRNNHDCGLRTTSGS